jgi:maleylpyruvate isomerase
MKLYGYFRSSASYRVRIALNLKQVEVEHVFRHLRRGEQNTPDYLSLNPQGLVPTLVADDGKVLTQSLAIIEWLDETFPSPALLPRDAFARAKVRAFALAIAADIHPIQNLRVLSRVRSISGSDEATTQWAAWVNRDGLAACEKMLACEPGPFCFGPTANLADICLVPQLANARRFGVDVAAFPRLLEAEAAANALAAFIKAAPSQQGDAE